MLCDERAKVQTELRKPRSCNLHICERGRVLKVEEEIREREGQHAVVSD